MDIGRDGTSRSAGPDGVGASSGAPRDSGAAPGEAARVRALTCGNDLIPQKVYIKSFCKSQFPHKSVNVSFIINHIGFRVWGSEFRV